MNILARPTSERPAASVNRCLDEQPGRRRNSIRRTSSIQSSWPDGAAAPARMEGRARDLLTMIEDGSAHCLGEDWLVAALDVQRRLLNLRSSRQNEIVASFAGLGPGGQLRKAMAERLAEEARAETRLNRLLDDLAGANFMSTAAFYGWPGGLEQYHRETGTPSLFDRPVLGVCISYVDGSPAVRPDGSGNDDNADHPVGHVALTQRDHLAFHDLAAEHGPNQWRLRRTDLWREGDLIEVDAWFQDSSVLPGNSDKRLIFHEYSLRASFSANGLELCRIDVEPYVLPYLTCRAAPETASVLIGQSASEFRSAVPGLLGGSAGCTHLNDMLRSLQDVAGIARLLPAVPL